MLLAAAALADPAADLAAQHFQQGLAYERLGRIPAAYTELQLASTLGPQDAQIALALGIVAARLGRIDAAQRALEQSMTLDSGSVASYFELALIYESKSLKERALDCWHRFQGLSQDELLKQMAQKHIRHLDMLGTESQK